MRAPLHQLDQCATLITAAPARPLAHFENGLQLGIIRAVLAEGMRGPLAHDTHTGVAVGTDHFKGMFRVQLAGRRDELAADGRIGTKDAGFPGRAVLHDGFEEELLLVGGQDRLDDGAGDGLSAAARRHFGLVGDGLRDDDDEAVVAVAVAAGERFKRVGVGVEVFAAADAGAGL